MTCASTMASIRRRGSREARETAGFGTAASISPCTSGFQASGVTFSDSCPEPCAMARAFDRQQPTEDIGQ